MNPDPLTAAEFTVTGRLPVDLSVKVRLTAVSTTTLPNARLETLRLSVRLSAFKCRAKVVEALPLLAVRVAVCCALTVETVAVNVALVALAGTFTVAGTETAALPLARSTVTPLVGAVKVTVHLSVPDPVRDELSHETWLNPASTLVCEAGSHLPSISE